MKIQSFTIDHLKLKRGIYVSRRDGDITTFDLRIRRPYEDDTLTQVEMHSLEHLLATALRNGPLGQSVIYVGPMGCATGFYVLYRAVIEDAAVKDIIDGLGKVLLMDNMAGNTPIECGNCNTLDLAQGKRISEEYLKTLSGKTKPDVYKK